MFKSSYLQVTKPIFHQTLVALQEYKLERDFRGYADLDNSRQKLIVLIPINCEFQGAFGVEVDVYFIEANMTNVRFRQLRPASEKFTFGFAKNSC